MKASLELSRDASKTGNVPAGVITLGAWSWRLLAFFAALAVVIFIIIQLYIVVVPVLIAILVAALLHPLNRFLRAHGWPKWLTVATSLIGLIVVLGGLITLIVQQVRSSLPALKTQGADAYARFGDFLQANYGVSPGNLGNDASVWLQGNTQAVTSGLASVGSTAGHVLTGLFIALFATIFFLADGSNIWSWVVRLFPRTAREAINGAGKSGWRTLTSFVRTQVVVAAVDAVGIGLGAFILGLPLAIPIAVAVFLGAFIPVVGAIITGTFAIIIALIFVNPAAALIMLLVVLVVQQIESHILQPFLIGKSVSVHPLAVVLGVAVGSLLAGIPGALFSVPLIAVANSMGTYIAEKRWLTDTAAEPSAKKPRADVSAR